MEVSEMSFPTQQSQRAQEEASIRKEGSMTILVVDSYPLICELIANELKNEGYRTLAASDGMEAQKMILRLGAASIKLVIAELLLPHIDGKELVKWFLYSNPQGRAIIMSASPFNENPGKRIALLKKPFFHEDLMKKINELCSSQGLASASSMQSV